MPGLRLVWTRLAAVPGPSPPELRERLRRLSDRFGGAQAIALRRQPIPHAYRVFFRHIGLEPDEHRVPAEALALERMQAGGFRSRSLLDDAITIAVIDTHVPVWALDAARVEGGLELRAAFRGERLGRDPQAPGVPSGRLVVADAGGPLQCPLRPARRRPRRDARLPRARALLRRRPGRAAIHVEEALWSVWDTVG